MGFLTDLITDGYYVAQGNAWCRKTDREVARMQRTIDAVSSDTKDSGSDVDESTNETPKHSTPVVSWDGE